MCSNGNMLINTKATAASEPSKPARGKMRRMWPDTREQASLNRPLVVRAHMPNFQA